MGRPPPPDRAPIAAAASTPGLAPKHTFQVTSSLQRFSRAIAESTRARTSSCLRPGSSFQAVTMPQSSSIAISRCSGGIRCQSTYYVRPFHDLRHASLTNGAAAGETPIVLMTRAGHRSMATTKQYLHLAGVVFRDEADARAADARRRR
jgi:integrase